MAYVVKDAPIGAKAFDTVSRISPEQAQALRAAGFEVAFLYAEMLTAEDLAHCTDAGIAVVFTIEGLGTQTIPTSDLGTKMARSAVERMRAMGVPDGATYAVDLEGDGRDWDEWHAFADAAGSALNVGGDLSCAYVGEGIGLSSAELYGLRVHRYWRGMSRIVDRFGNLAEPACGWCAVQQYPTIAVAGLEVDVDVIGRDYHGRTLTVVTAG
jgi:hypothetical protein